MKSSTSIVAVLVVAAAAFPTPDSLSARSTFKQPYRLQSAASQNGVNWLLSPSEQAPQEAPAVLIKFYRDETTSTSQNAKYTLELETPQKVTGAQSRWTDESGSIITIPAEAEDMLQRRQLGSGKGKQGKRGKRGGGGGGLPDLGGLLGGGGLPDLGSLASGLGGGLPDLGGLLGGAASPAPSSPAPSSPEPSSPEPSSPEPPSSAAPSSDTPSSAGAASSGSSASSASSSSNPINAGFSSIAETIGVRIGKSVGETIGKGIGKAIGDFLGTQVSSTLSSALGTAPKKMVEPMELNELALS